MIKAKQGFTDYCDRIIEMLPSIVLDMKYQYVVLNAVRGLFKQTDSDKELINDLSSGFRAILTSNPDALCFEIDRKMAVACSMLNNMFGGHGEQLTPEERIDAEIRKIRESRKEKHKDDLYLVCIMEGDVDDFESSHENEIGDFIVCLDAVPKESIITGAKPYVLAALSALVLSTDSNITFTELSKSSVFFRGDGKPIYPFQFSSSANLSTSSPITPETLASIEGWYKILSTEKDLDKVKRLLVASVQIKDDRLRSFIFAWTALESFVNKVFPLYEERFFDESKSHIYSEPRNQYIAYVRNVMKDKHRLVDKFSLISSYLSSEDATKE